MQKDFHQSGSPNGLVSSIIQEICLFIQTCLITIHTCISLLKCYVRTYIAIHKKTNTTRRINHEKSQSPALLIKKYGYRSTFYNYRDCTGLLALYKPVHSENMTPLFLSQWMLLKFYYNHPNHTVLDSCNTLSYVVRQIIWQVAIISCIAEQGCRSGAMGLHAAPQKHS